MTDKFGMAAMGLGPLPGVTETMDFVRRAWSSFGVPSAMAPTLELDEIDKRIADLRTVEQWLSLNLNMLQSAIQGLEIQRGTVAAIKAFGEAVGTTAGLDPAAAAKAMAAMAAATARTPGTRAAADQAQAEGAGQAQREPPAAPPAAARSAGASTVPPRRPDSAASAGDAEDAVAADPAAWWNLLQNQFSQVAQAALAGAAAVTPAFAATAAPADATPPGGGAAGRAPAAARGARKSGKASAPGSGRRTRRPAG